jgi:GMP synthase-like glutamine amidotransferase
VKIGLLVCDHVPERFRHIAGGYRAMFGTLFRPQAPHVTLRHFDVCHGELPQTTDTCDAYVCTGSRYSVYDKLDWIGALEAFVRRVHEARAPFAGICFGHQMLAQALGGTVTPAPEGWGVGVHGMRILHSEPWMQPPLATCRLQYMHQDQVMEFPPEAVLLGSAAHCPVAMFRCGESMLGIEGHPEFPAAYNEALMRYRIGRIGEARVRAGLETVRQGTDGAVVGQWIVRFFAQSAAREGR